MDAQQKSELAKDAAAAFHTRSVRGWTTRTLSCVQSERWRSSWAMGTEDELTAESGVESDSAEEEFLEDHEDCDTEEEGHARPRRHSRKDAGQHEVLTCQVADCGRLLGANDPKYFKVRLALRSLMPAACAACSSLDSSTGGPRRLLQLQLGPSSPEAVSVRVVGQPVCRWYSGDVLPAWRARQFCLASLTAAATLCCLAEVQGLREARANSPAAALYCGAVDAPPLLPLCLGERGVPGRRAAAL